MIKGEKDLLTELFQGSPSEVEFSNREKLKCERENSPTKQYLTNK